jgi:hypothetical protein
VKRKRHGELRRQFDRAYAAFENREWWDGKRWRSNEDFPRTPDEVSTYKTAHEVMEETNRAMIGDGAPNSDEAYKAAGRFERSYEADLDRGKHTKQEADASVIFDAAKPLLREYPRRPPWTKLAADLTSQLIDKRLNDPTITAARLRLICLRRK